MASADRPIFIDQSNSGRFDLLSRRQFFRLFAIGSAATLAACSSRQEAPAEVPGIRRELGRWSQSEVETLALEMKKDPQLYYIANAGEALLDNQQGRPSFSTYSPIFTDDKVKFATIDHISPSSTGLNLPTPVGTHIKEVTPRIVVSVRSKTTGLQERILVPPALKFEEIQLNHELTKDRSDLLLQFYIAKEVLNAKAFGMVTSWMAVNTIYTQYDKPQDIKAQNGIQASMMNSGFGEIPTFFMANLWAHYLLVPDYLVASEQDRFSSGEANGDELRIFKLAGEVFQKRGVLTRNSEGVYAWTQDSNKFFSEWIDFSIAGWNAMKPKRYL